jgi:hypothetical protein
VVFTLKGHFTALKSFFKGFWNFLYKIWSSLFKIIGNGKLRNVIISSELSINFIYILVVIATLLDAYCPAPTFIVAILLAGGGLMCLFLPNTTRKALS